MAEAKGMHEQTTTGCLPVDQSCFALSRLSTAYRNSSTARARARNNDPACCSTTSYLEVLGISFASLLIVLFVLCMIRCYLMRRAVNRVTVGAAAAPTAVKKRPAGLGEDAIAALPKFEYRDTGDEGDRWECAICLCAMADGEVARQLPRCMHVFHRACVDMWLVAHTTCPVCRAEVVKSADDAHRCAAETPAAAEAGPSSASASTALEDGERDLEAQL